MTEAEAFEMALPSAANATNAFNQYITFTFGYITTAYFVGNKLSRFQVLAASGLYLVAAPFAFGNALTDIQWMAKAVEHTGDLSPEGIAANMNFWLMSSGSIMALGILVSLYFMWNVRHPRTE
jgi:hypothetical protein